jgi:hypothetical protein
VIHSTTVAGGWSGNCLVQDPARIVCAQSHSKKHLTSLYHPSVAFRSNVWILRRQRCEPQTLAELTWSGFLSTIQSDQRKSPFAGVAENALFEKIVSCSVRRFAAFDTSKESLAKDVDGKRCRTICFITHRFNTVRRADKIAVFKEVRSHRRRA